MGLGCNAAGVVGCRIIDSKRERLLAILTNSFIPCNGRFPTLIALITMFYIGSKGGILSSINSALILSAILIISILTSFLATKLLSETVLKGATSSYTLELSPFRKPQFGQVIVRSVFDRTLFVLGRALSVAAPAGAIIWIMANANIDGISLLKICSGFLDPLGHLMGLDGIILMAFILGFPANETVIPIMLMAYLSNGHLSEYASLAELKNILVQNGWTFVTATCTMLFSLMHWPCSTTLITIKKETGSTKWTLLAAVLPTIFGIIACVLFSTVAKMFI